MLVPFCADNCTLPPLLYWWGWYPPWCWSMRLSATTSQLWCDPPGWRLPHIENMWIFFYIQRQLRARCIQPWLFYEEATCFSPAVTSCAQLTGQRKAKISSYLTRRLPASRLMAVSCRRRRWQQLVTRLMYTLAAVAETRIFFQMYFTESAVSLASLQSMEQGWCVNLRKASWVTPHLPFSMDLNEMPSLPWSK